MAGVATIGWMTDAVDTNKISDDLVDGPDPPYFQRYFGLFMKGMLGKTFDRGLSNLQKQLEI